MAEPLQPLIDEFEAAERVLREFVEGMLGIARTGLSEAAVSQLKDALLKLTHRHSLVLTAIEVLKALQMDGYPVVMPPALSDEVIDEIEAKIGAMDMAFGKISEKVIGILRFGLPEPK